ncbi:MAG: galactose-1-phosphate uridylyltransferase, partial [Clostridia bacterium]|nr:galactose-1-phosphate uridylyltransferase [Clostridia bacterium]
MIYNSIKKLITYGLEKGLFKESDKIFVTNQVIDALNLAEYEEPADVYTNVDLESTLKEILDYAVEKGIIEDSIVYRDLFDTRIMGLMMPRPSEVIEKFYNLYEEDALKATDYFYQISCDSDYIRRYRIKKDLKWLTDTEYGQLEITVNLSKPEKDPKAIAA